MIHIRPFLNSDPPAIVAIWNAQPEEKQVSRHIEVATLEHFVLAKPYFDREGILVALADDQIVGFVHAGFGPDAHRSNIDLDTGVICKVQLLPDWNTPQANQQLLQAAEAYLFARGAQRILGGPISPFECFYHGLSSTGESVGIPEDDVTLREAYTASGYAIATNHLVFHRDLTAFRPPFDRKQRTLQRNYEVLVDLDTDMSDWWELCRYGPLPRCGFHLISKRTREKHGGLVWWDQAFTGSALQSTVAFTEIEIPPAYRRQGLGTLLMNDAMRQLKSSGAFFATALVDESNVAGIAFLQAVGFQERTRGFTFVKQRP